MDFKKSFDYVIQQQQIKEYGGLLSDVYKDSHPLYIHNFNYDVSVAVMDIIERRPGQFHNIAIVCYWIDGQKLKFREIPIQRDNDYNKYFLLAGQAYYIHKMLRYTPEGLED